MRGCQLAVAGQIQRIDVIASGGAGTLDDFVDVFTKGRADAALAGFSALHETQHANELIAYRQRMHHPFIVGLVARAEVERGGQHQRRQHGRNE